MSVLFKAKKYKVWIDWLDTNTINNLELKAFITSVLTELSKGGTVMSSERLKELYSTITRQSEENRNQRELLHHYENIIKEYEKSLQAAKEREEELFIKTLKDDPYADCLMK